MVLSKNALAAEERVTVSHALLARRRSGARVWRGPAVVQDVLQPAQLASYTRPSYNTNLNTR